MAFNFINFLLFAIGFYFNNNVKMVTGNSSMAEIPSASKSDALRYWNEHISSTSLHPPEFFLKKASPLTAAESAHFSKLADQNLLSAHLSDLCKKANLHCFQDDTISSNMVGVKGGLYTYGCKTKSHMDGAKGGLYTYGFNTKSTMDGAKGGLYTYGFNTKSTTDGAKGSLYTYGFNTKSTTDGAKGGLYTYGFNTKSNMDGAKGGLYTYGFDTKPNMDGAKGGLYTYGFDTKPTMVGAKGGLYTYGFDTNTKPNMDGAKGGLYTYGFDTNTKPNMDGAKGGLYTYGFNTNTKPNMVGAKGGLYTYGFNTNTKPNTVGAKGGLYTYGFNEFTEANPDTRKFFREATLKTNTIMPMPNLIDNMLNLPFLPRRISSKLPFCTSKINEIKSLFHIKENEAMIIANTLSDCERAPTPGETKKCVASMEDMIDFATGMLGHNLLVKRMETTEGSNGNIMVGKVKRINDGKITNVVSCHAVQFPYLVYYCHSVPQVRVYEADILDPVSKVKINHGVAICHVDTSSWIPNYLPFKQFGSSPGKIEVCHWIFGSGMIWTIADWSSQD